MGHTFTIAHLSDVHLPPPQLPSLGEFDAKRLLGVANWIWRRRAQHSLRTTQLLLDDLARQQTDHVAVTGDLVNFGLESELLAAGRWIARVGPPERVSVVPGNHDIYTDQGAGACLMAWSRYMTGSGSGAELAGGHQFPYLRRLGHVALVGLNSALPTPPFRAFGQLGDGQLARLATLLDQLEHEGAVRVVLIHHPPLPGLAKPKSALRDADRLADVLLRHGAELVLHGHNHRAMSTTLDGPRGRCAVIGVPSASIAIPHGQQTPAAYNLYRIAAGRLQPIEMITRRITPSGEGFEETGRMAIGGRVDA